MYNRLKDYFYLLRPAQWLKNLLVIAPPFFGGVLFENTTILYTMFLAFLSFSLASSTAYIINDISDTESDRLHPKKKLRPLASGRVGIAESAVLALVIFIISVLIALQINNNFLIVILAYLALSLMYSFYFGNIVIIEVFIIALGFVLRIEAGGLAGEVPVSNWLLLTTFLLSLLLALGKRRFELTLMKLGGAENRFRPVLSKYRETFLDMTLSIFATTAIVTYSIYTVETSSRVFLATVPFVCYGVLRYMYLVQTDKSGDPTESLLRDKSLFICVFAWLFLTGLIIYFDDFHSLFP